MDERLYTIDDETQDVSNGRPHVVILGAGASRAAFLDGDRNGQRLPLMNDLVKVLGLDRVLEKHRIPYRTDENFEEIYSKLYSDPNCSDALADMAFEVREYFRKLELPQTPTIYDYLVLSLRRKDVIATFNWDPFLFAALRRNHGVAELPKAFFLHGAVNVGYCVDHKVKGDLDGICSSCGKAYTPTPLLYPITKKNYTEDHFIKSEWNALQYYLKHAYILTIFGYSAPTSDVEAIELLKGGWGSSDERNLEEIEIINTRPRDELIETWKDFIHTHHYQTTKNFFESFIANHPRRTCEAMWAQLMEVKYIDNNPAPQNVSLEKL